MVLKVMKGSFDFKLYFSELGITVAGLTPNPKAHALHTTHCWRFVRRAETRSALKRCRSPSHWACF